MLQAATTGTDASAESSRPCRSGTWKAPPSPVNSPTKIKTPPTTSHWSTTPVRFSVSTPSTRHLEKLSRSRNSHVYAERNAPRFLDASRTMLPRAIGLLARLMFTGLRMAGRRARVFKAVAR